MSTSSAILSATEFARDAVHDAAIDQAITAGKSLHGDEFYVVVVADLGNARTAQRTANLFGISRADSPAQAYIGAVTSDDVDGLDLSIVDESGATFSADFPTDADAAIVLVLKDDTTVAFSHTTTAAEHRAARTTYNNYVASVAERETGSAEEAALIFSGTPDFGRDVSTFVLNPEDEYDVDSNFTVIDGTRVVSEAIARRLVTPRGSLEYDPDFGLDLRAWVNAGLTDTGAENTNAPDLFAMRAAIEAECLKDERVDSVVADVRHDVSDRSQPTITVRVMIELVTDAAFRLVLTIDAVTAAILKVTT